jgi:hypothetical protein
MKWETTDSFKGDFKRLSAPEKKLFRDAVEKFNVACDHWADSNGASGWPAALRVKPVEAAPGVFEMTWSFSGPDGRATWEWTTITTREEKSRAVRWRRVGGHEVFKKP